MKYLRLALLALMLAGVFALSSNTPTTSAKNFCWDCYTTYQRGDVCYPLVGCSYNGAGQCVYDMQNGSTECRNPMWSNAVLK
jgi:hypothetical protein